MAAEAAFVPAADLLGEGEGVAPRLRLQVEWLDWDRARLLRRRLPGLTLRRRRIGGLTLRERTLDRDLDCDLEHLERDLEHLECDLEEEPLEVDGPRAMATAAAEVSTDTSTNLDKKLQTSSKP